MDIKTYSLKHGNIYVDKSKGIKAQSSVTASVRCLVHLMAFLPLANCLLFGVRHTDACDRDWDYGLLYN